MKIFIGLYLVWLDMSVHADKGFLTCKTDSAFFNDILNLSSIRIILYPNLSPRGAKQECHVELNNFFEKPL